MPFNNGDKAFVKNVYQTKMQVSEDADKIFEDKLQKKEDWACY